MSSSRRSLTAKPTSRRLLRFVALTFSLSDESLKPVRADAPNRCATRCMYRFLRYLDEKGWPQKVVGWLLARRRRKQARRNRYSDRREGSHAIALFVASPLFSGRSLIEDFIPSKGGTSAEFHVRARCLGRHQATLVIQEMRAGLEFTFVLPRHHDFNKDAFRSCRRVQVTCEAERSRLYSVRNRHGTLIAAGTLELHKQAAFSEELTQAHLLLSAAGDAE